MECRLWHSHREMRAGPAMGWCRSGQWCVGRVHSACTGRFQAKSADPSCHKTKFTEEKISMLKWTPLPIFKRIIGELKWKLTGRFTPFFCDLGRLQEQREATRAKSFPSLLPCAEFSPGVWVAHMSPTPLGTFWGCSGVRLHEPSSSQGRQEQRWIWFCLSFLSYVFPPQCKHRRQTWDSISHTRAPEQW